MGPVTAGVWRWLVGTAVLAVLLSATVAGPAGAQSNARVTWRVENPFRFFTNASDTEVHRATYQALGVDARVAPILASERALQARHEDGWAATMFRKTCWNPVKNSFSCDAYDDYVNPTSHGIAARLEDVDEALTLNCTWKTAPKGGSLLRGSVVTQPCNEEARFKAPYPDGLDIVVEIGGVEVARTHAKVRDLLIVGMGDSFASGEGNPDIAVRFSRERSADYGASGEDGGLAGYPARVGDWRSIGDKKFIAENARWLDQACHRSLYSHQLRAALQLAIEDPHRAVTYAGVSCSGAEVTFGLFLRYKGNEWVPNPPMLSQISAIAEVQCGVKNAEPLDLPEAYHIDGKIPELKGGLVLRKCPQERARKIDLVFLSIGGNDIGFSRLVANTVLTSESLLRQLGGWLGEVHGQSEAEGQLSHLDARYKSLNRAIHNILYMPWNESDRVVLTGYPGMALTGDGSETCSDGRAGLDVLPDFRLSQQKLREGVWVGDKLHHVMRDSAEHFGWTFVETHRRAFIGRGICSGSELAQGNPADELLIPRKIGGVWKPYNPADYHAYASRKRWFRTPNDAFMTGNFHVASSVLTKVLKLETLQWFQLLLASTYSGAFHPTAEGQAAIADAVAEKSRVVLKKYGQGPDPRPATEYEMPVPAAEEPGVSIPDVAPAMTHRWAPQIDEPTAATGEPGATAAGEAQGSVNGAPVGAAATETPGATVSEPGRATNTEAVGAAANGGGAVGGPRSGTAGQTTDTTADEPTSTTTSEPAGSPVPSTIKPFAPPSGSSSSSVTDDTSAGGSIH